MLTERIDLWETGEYSYPLAFGFIPNIRTYCHKDGQIRPAIMVIPGGAYYVASPTEGEIVAKKFYDLGFQTFVLTYTTNVLVKEPLRMTALKDVCRALRILRKNAEFYELDPDRLSICGFSAGGHLSASACVHSDDITEENPLYQPYSGKPSSAILSYPVIQSANYAHVGSFQALLGEDIYEKAKLEGPEGDKARADLEYMSLEKHINASTPPCFLWQTQSDELVPVENSYLFAKGCKENGVLFEHHVFPRGRHGLSLSNDDWTNARFGEPYTMEQEACIARAAERGEIDLTAEMLESLKLMSGLKVPEGGPQLQEGAVKEVSIWPELAAAFLHSL